MDEMTMESFLTMRYSMVRGGRTFPVDSALSPSRELETMQHLALSSRPAEVKMNFTKEPRGKIVVDEGHPPMGPAAPLKRLKVGTLPPPERVVEKVFNDSDLKSSEGIRKLYESGVEVERISRLLSVGALGVRRKLVPTRWGITAVDKQLSDAMVEEVKRNPWIDKVELYVRGFRENLFVAILMPGNWAYEWGESWFPSTTWNPWGAEEFTELDWEGYRGRTTYPGIGGCYYAARLAVTENLKQRGRQTSVILWREIYPGFNLPVGVWFVRENVRELLRGRPETVDTLEEALQKLRKITRAKGWETKSWMVKTIRSRLFQ